MLWDRPTRVSTQPGAKTEYGVPPSASTQISKCTFSHSELKRSEVHLTATPLDPLSLQLSPLRIRNSNLTSRTTRKQPVPAHCVSQSTADYVRRRKFYLRVTAESDPECSSKLHEFYASGLTNVSHACQKYELRYEMAFCDVQDAAGQSSMLAAERKASHRKNGSETDAGTFGVSNQASQHACLPSEDPDQSFQNTLIVDHDARCTLSLHEVESCTSDKSLNQRAVAQKNPTEMTEAQADSDHS